MLNPRELAGRIDEAITRGAGVGRATDVALIVADIFSRLPANDRRGIHPEVMEMIVRARLQRRRILDTAA